MQCNSCDTSKSCKWVKGNICNTCYCKDQNRKHKDRLNESKRNRRKEIKLTDPNRLKDIDLRNKRGIGWEDRSKLFKEQNGCCAICNIPESQLNRVLFVDHNHTNGQIRGLLCDKCNTGIGMFLEKEELFLSALKYLEKYK